MQSYNRTRGELEAHPPVLSSTSRYREYKNAPPVNTNTTGSYIPPGSNGKVMYDVVTPSYKKLSGDGKIINNPMTIIEESCQVIPQTGQMSLFTRAGYAPNGTLIRDEVFWNNVVPGGIRSSGSPFKGPLPDVSQNAINDAIAASHQRNVMGMVDLLEAHKTVALLKQNAQRLESLLRGVPLRRLGRKHFSKNGKVALSKYKPRTVAGRASDAAGLHLEIQYGFLPLMMTIEGLMKTFMDYDPPIRQTFRGSNSDDDRTVDKIYENVTGLSGNVIGQLENIFICERSTYARAGVLTEYRPPLQGLLGLEFRDIPTAAYELIKFSFVLDWWYDLGSFIEAAVPVPGYSQLASWSTVVHKEVVSHTRFGPYMHDTKTEGSGSSQFTRSITHYNYQCGISWTRETKVRTPNISVGAPKLDLNYRSFTHAVSALALAITLGKSSLTRRI